MLRRLLPFLFLAACSRPAPSGAPPRAEFLLVAGDSTYWVTSGPAGVKVRGSPIVLARYGGRFHELYLADDDHSYYDALLVGQTIYSRDLITGDSVAVFTDTLVDRVASRYAADHPDESPLDADEDVADQPRVSATSDVSLLDVHGPFLSIEYHADTRERPRPGFHTTWRSVIDLRVGHPVPLSSVVGPEEAARVIARARGSYRSLLDSARAGEGALGPIVDLVLSQVTFDERSFQLADLHGGPAVEFAGRIAGRRDGHGALPLPPIPVDSGNWWSEVRPTLPTDSDTGSVRWVRPDYTLLARVDTTDSVAAVALVDSARHAFPVGQVQTPVRRVYWLDRPAIDSTTRSALDRAFNDASLYDENARVAVRRASPGVARFHPAALVDAHPRPAARRFERRRSTRP
ncbi:MAG: hypothetical protein KGL93_03845 [Gemmatimonadota bacterium]|nr:hypothetical protein [Gemmatimonadota bacterium]